MNSRRFSHIKDVFSFTFRQQMRGKGFVIMTYVLPIVFLLVFMAINVIMAATSDKNKNDYCTKQIYLMDETGTDQLQLVLSKVLSENEDFKSVEIKMAEGDTPEKVCDKLGEDNKEFLVIRAVYDKDKNKFIITEYVPDWSNIKSSEYNDLLSVVEGAIPGLKVMTSGIDTETVMYMQSSSMVSVRSADEDAKDFGSMVMTMLVPMFGMLIIYLCLMIFGQGTGKVVAVEKNSKLMEYMLTVIHPDALITGKVFAASFMSFMQIMLWILGGVCGFIGGEQIGKLIAPDYVNEMSSFLSTFVKQTASALSPASILMAVIALASGFILYGFISGLFASFVSKPEELSSTMGLYNLIVMVGFFGAYFPILGTNESVKTIVRLIPLTSAMVLPFDIAVGNAGYLIGGLGLGILVLTCIIMAVICGRVYRARIFYNGKGLPSFLKAFK